jgi:hypothetical protein
MSFVHCLFRCLSPSAKVLGLLMVITTATTSAFPIETSAATSASLVLRRNVPERQRRRFIGLPEVNTISVQNTSTFSMPITVTFALTDSTVISQVFDTLAPESFGIYAEPPNFLGTGQVEGLADSLDDFNVFGVNFELSDKGNTAYLGLRYEEPGAIVSTQSPRINPSVRLQGLRFLPLVDQTSGWRTEFVLQNASFSNAALVVSVYNQDGVFTGNYIGVLPAKGSLPIDVSTIPGVTSNFIGSIVVSSDQVLTVASSVRISNSGLGLSTSYPEVDDTGPSTLLVAPALFKANDLQTSRLCVQNTGEVNASVTVAYSDGQTGFSTIQSSATYCFHQEAEAHASGWSGGATISSTQPLVGVVDVFASDSANKTVGRWTYTIPAAADLNQKTIALPVLFNNYRQFNSAVHLFNPGTQPAVVTRRYTAFADGFVFCPSPITIAPNSYVALSQSEALAFIDVSMGYITSTQPIAAVVSMKSSKTLGTTQRNLGYQAAYPHAPVAPQKPCNLIYFAYLPLVRR